MSQVVRRVLALVAACGFFAAVLAYVESYRGIAWGAAIPWAFVGIFILNTPMILVEYSAFTIDIPPWKLFLGGRPIQAGSFSWKAYGHGTPMFNEFFFWKGFSHGMPRWVVPTIKLLGLLFAVHFVLFLIASHAALPEIRNGEYVLLRGSRVLEVLSPSDYFNLKRAELRMFATGWIFFYFVPTMYWWFPRNRTLVSQQHVWH